jgi:hypothetical protein
MRAHNPCRRPGNVVVAVATSLVTLLACVALAVDAGMMQDRRRNVQSAADAAAIAAADQLYYNWAFYKGVDVDGSAAAAARAIATANGYTDGANGTTVAVNIPPLTGLFVGQKGYAEVVIQFSHPRYFSQPFGTDAIPIRARAVARGRKSAGKEAILCLDPTVKGALNAGGGGTMTVTGSAIQVNSDNYNAAIFNGGGTITLGTGSELDVTGTGPGYAQPGGGTINGNIATGTDPIPDPLAYLTPPDPSTMQVRSTKKITNSGGNTLNLQPGVYIGGISVTGKGALNLAPGIYYMEQGGFNWGGQGSITGYGVTIYTDPGSNADGISLTGTGTCVLTPPSDGPTQGILFWERRDSTAPINVVGQGNLTITGTFYGASAPMKVTGNGASDMIGSQYIVDTLVTGGTGTFSVDWNPNTVPGLRIIALVE